MQPQDLFPRHATAALRRLLTAGLVAALVLTGLVASAPPANALPSNLVLNGHGWGHGRGMGQFGAHGYATMFGWGSSTILDHFYGGTGAGTVAAGTPISVRLMAMEGLDLWVTSGAPFTVAGYAQPAGAAVYVTVDANGTYLVAGTQGAAGCGGPLHPQVAVPGPVVASSLAGAPGNDLSKMLTICGGPTYRGELRFVRADGVSHTVNVVPVEDYLRGVVPRESPSWFAPAALQAQAVAARSYALAEGGEFGQRYSYAKTCDTTACQVYGGAGLDGVSREPAPTNDAIAATANLVRRFGDGTLARTEFSSSTGGWTAGGTFPARPDDGDAVAVNPRHKWQTTLSASSISARYGIGQFVGIQITQRNGFGEWGGRVLQLSVIGTSKSVTVSGAQFQSDWALFSTWFTTDGSNGPSAVSPSPGRTDVFARGGDGAVWQRSQANGGLGTWQSLGGTITSDPDVSSWGGGRLDVFARGTDGALWHRGNNGSGWAGWESLGGSLESGPTAVSWGPNRIDVFAKGSDGALWSKAWTGAAWTNWYSLGGGFVGDPDVASWGPNRLDVFIRGLDNRLWHIGWNGAVWSPWENLGGALTSGPGAVSWGANRIDVFGRGGDGQVWSRAWTGSVWVGWYPLGGGLSSDPDAAAPASNRLEIVARGLDAAIWQKSWTGSAWSSWFSLGPPG